ncbi:hypothetical protein CPB84DRAFT_361120 [Gymnopilus junonius]|uniref:Uncharacterized protein n=1 Tax=Gymnopilus junonius TaxID=109634 RepID=A0A9P5NRN6_GYMJU|nr:hypothetical protein CPB84DRAFT_361120 [Gymnopilus junonius]
MLRCLEYWNISWWVAQLSQAFTWGSVVGLSIAFLPFCNLYFMKAPHSLGWTAFLGATVFEIGSIFGILEAWNRDDTASFGSNLKKALSSNSGETTRGLIQPQEKLQSVSANQSPADKESESQKRWKWISVDPKYFHEVGFLASFFQLLVASIFWISGFPAIPTIQDSLQNSTGLDDGIFWTPQVIGGRLLDS